MVEEAVVNSGYLPSVWQNWGKNLLDQPEARAMGYTAAFWRFVDDLTTWKLHFATPLTDTKGPLYVYDQMQLALKKMKPMEKGELDLPDVAVISPNSQVVVDMLRQYGVVEQEDQRLVRRTSGPYIYRLTKAESKGKRAEKI